MEKILREIVVPREDAVFWMDGNGRWHNQHGPFEHKKIIDFFHASIQKDDIDYHLVQIRGNIREKVYFPYQDTPLFVFGVIKTDKDIILVLNTKKQVKLIPQNLYVKNDDLFMVDGQDRIKFTDRSLLKISDVLDEDQSGLCIRIGNKSYPVSDRSEKG